uniref:Reverse transcriptase/retrotransposon-derived protein RNase H-like domain-containing protein n=1 Tax=Kryptolebias marmoratus TaxID=37003 RepID=A0A3Q3A1A1_KRYMA
HLTKASQTEEAPEIYPQETENTHCKKNLYRDVVPPTGGRYAFAVLCQSTQTGLSPQPVAYYSTAFSEVELGLPLCYRAMVGVGLTIMGDLLICQTLPVPGSTRCLMM